MSRLFHLFRTMDAKELKNLTNDISRSSPPYITDEWLHKQLTSPAPDITMNKMCKDARLFIILLYIYMYPSCRECLQSGWLLASHDNDIFYKRIEHYMHKFIFSMDMNGQPSEVYENKYFISSADLSYHMRIWYCRNY